MGELLVALDVDSGARARQLATELRHVVGGVKIGSRLFTLEGPSLVQALAADGIKVFEQTAARYRAAGAIEPRAGRSWRPARQGRS